MTEKAYIDEDLGLVDDIKEVINGWSYDFYSNKDEVEILKNAIKDVITEYKRKGIISINNKELWADIAENNIWLEELNNKKFFRYEVKLGKSIWVCNECHDVNINVDKHKCRKIKRVL